MNGKFYIANPREFFDKNEWEAIFEKACKLKIPSKTVMEDAICDYFREKYGFKKVVARTKSVGFSGLYKIHDESNVTIMSTEIAELCFIQIFDNVENKEIYPAAFVCDCDSSELDIVKSKGKSGDMWYVTVPAAGAARTFKLDGIFLEGVFC